MAEWENRIFCRLDGLTITAREQKRLMALRELNLLDAPIVPVFDEATQTAARFLDAPICILGLMTLDQLLIKSAIGLSRVGLMNQLAQSRQLPRLESFCTYVVDSHQALVINDTATNPLFARSVLVGHYGIRAYMGVPLLTSDGQCLGTLAVMDWEPRDFTPKDLEFLAITARWSISEFDRNHLLQQETTRSIFPLPQLLFNSEYSQGKDSDAITKSQESGNGLHNNNPTSTNLIKLRLLTHLTQELRTPLTSVMGMASVLNRQVYGPLTSKQKEYIEIIHSSGQHLVNIVEEIVNLGLLDETIATLNLGVVDIEMLCQKAINCLFETAQAKQQQIRLSVEPGNRLWLLDKDKVRQIIYYLLFSVIHSAEAGGEVRLHVSRHPKNLKILVWVSHPWLGDGIPPVYGRMSASPISLSAYNSEVSESLETSMNTGKVENSEPTLEYYQLPSNPIISGTSVLAALNLTQELKKIPTQEESRASLGLILSCHLAELHQGQIIVQGSLERGYRYVINLPQLE